MKKKLISALLAVCAAATSSVPAMAYETVEITQQNESSITVTVNGNRINFPDQHPVIVYDRTLVPVRFIAEALGFNVAWNESANEVIIDNGTIKLYPETNIAEIGGTMVLLDTPCELINDRTMVPLRLIAETLGCTVDWFERINTVQIMSKNSDHTEVPLWDRFLASGMFTYIDDYATGYYGCAIPNEYADLKKEPAWYIKKDNNLARSDNDYDCTIIAYSYYPETLEDIKSALMVVFPTEYEKVYSMVIASLKGELWQTLRSGAGYLISGTWGTHYLDDREVGIGVEYGLVSMGITIHKPGYINPETPLELDADAIRDLTKEAKTYYPLARYGLNLARYGLN